MNPTRQTRQELEDLKIKHHNLYVVSIVAVIFLGIAILIGFELYAFSIQENTNLQSQLTELKQNGTYTIKCDTPKVEAPKIDNTTADYFCGKYNGTANYGLGTTYCEIVIKDVYNMCQIVRVGNSYAFDINPNYNSCNWSEVIPQ